MLAPESKAFSPPAPGSIQEYKPPGQFRSNDSICFFRFVSHYDRPDEHPKHLHRFGLFLAPYASFALSQLPRSSIFLSDFASSSHPFLLRGRQAVHRPLVGELRLEKRHRCRLFCHGCRFIGIGCALVCVLADKSGCQLAVVGLFRLFF